MSADCPPSPDVSRFAPLDKCVRCGSCRAACPVFDLTRRETDAARGRLARIRRALAAGCWTAADREALSRCLLCGRCADVCKAGVETTALVQAAKEDAGCGDGLIGVVAEALLADDAGLSAAVRRYRRFARWLTRATPEASGLRLRFALPYLEAGRLLPEPPAISYLDRWTGRPAQGGRKIALFLGCGAGRLFAGVGEELDRRLATLGLTAAVPPQACCGLAAWGVGAGQAAVAAAAAWVEAFSGEEWEAVLAPCASCAAHLQRRLPALLARTPLATTAKGLAARVEDAHAWLLREGGRDELAGRRVAVHLPCHARRDVREGRAVIAFLRRSGADVVELPKEQDELCCGMGGSFGARHPRLAQRIGRRKLEALLAAGPELIVTTCSGCLWQLRDLAASLGVATPIAMTSTGRR